MSETSHSPEPWVHGGGTNSPSDAWSSITAADGALVIYDSSNADELPVVVAQHQRIVACVNACRGIPTERLVKHGNLAFYHEIQDQMIATLREVEGRIQYGDPPAGIAPPEFDATVPLLLGETPCSPAEPS